MITYLQEAQKNKTLWIEACSHLYKQQQQQQQQRRRRQQQQQQQQQQM
jgi:hypothetical protein